MSLITKFKAAVAPSPQPSVVAGLPKAATIGLGLLGGVLQVVNYLVISASQPVHGFIALAIYFLIAAGVPPLTGSEFQGALHLPQWGNYMIQALLGVAVLAINTPSLGLDVVAVHWLSVSVTVFGTLGFSAASVVVPVVPSPVPAPVPATK